MIRRGTSRGGDEIDVGPICERPLPAIEMKNPPSVTGEQTTHRQEERLGRCRVERGHVAWPWRLTGCQIRLSPGDQFERAAVGLFVRHPPGDEAMLVEHDGTTVRQVRYLP